MVNLKKDVPLRQLSNFKIGGHAHYFVEIKSTKELIGSLKLWKKISSDFSQNKQKIFVLGGGTNLLIDDKGFDGLVIQNRIGDIKILNKTNNEELITKKILVGAGVEISELLESCIKNSLLGLEWAGGLPGTIGGAVRGNAGAFGGEIKDSISEVTSLNAQTLRILKRKNKDCQFGYRSSFFKRNGEIILSVVLSLKKGDRNEIARKIQEKIEYRKNRHPLEYPNIGSIFKNTDVKNAPKELVKEFASSIKNDPFPVLPTAKILATVGLLGKRVGYAMVSRKHPNFIVNLGHAKSSDVLELITQIKKIIKSKYKINLEEEITILATGN